MKVPPKEGLLSEFSQLGVGNQVKLQDKREPTERESGNAREVRQVPESVMTSSSTQEQMNHVVTRVSDREPSTVVVEIRLTRDEEIVHAHNQGIQVPTPDGGLSSLGTHTEESIERTIMPTVVPQLDGPTSICAPRRQPLPVTRRTAIPGGGFPDDSNSDSHDYRLCGSRGYSGRRRHYQERGGRPPDREGNQG